MKTFKSFLNEAGPNAKPKAKGEADFVAAHSVEITDKEDQATEGSAKVSTKDGSGKRKADRLDNKQAMGEEVEQIDEKIKVGHQVSIHYPGTAAHGKKGIVTDIQDGQAKVHIGGALGVQKHMKFDSGAFVKPGTKVPVGKDGKGISVGGTTTHVPVSALKKINEETKTYRQLMREANFTKKQTTMAHTIGKEFEKKGVGDETKGGPYAVASAMVRDKPEAAKKAYATIKSKMKEETDAEILFKLYDDLNEENQEMFMQQLEEDAEALLMFAKNLMEE